MKEVIIFFVIMILALVFLFLVEGPETIGASIFKALRFDFGKKEQPQEEEPVVVDNKPEYQPKPNIEKEEPKDTKEPEETNTREDPGLSPLSPYYEKITISSVNEETSRHPSVIRLRSRTQEEINITGWTIKTRHGEFKIPQGVEKYQSHKTGKDIVIEERLYIYIVGAKSPLGISFRFNNCLGYIVEDLYPRKSASCPRPQREDLYHLHPVCQEYILDVRRCEMPDYSDNLSIALKSSCVEYINDNFNYSGCYSNHNKDEDFLENYWYIYTKSDLVEPLHDIVYLYDRQGYLVDKYSY